MNGEIALAVVSPRVRAMISTISLVDYAGDIAFADDPSELGKLSMPAELTPTEVIAAWNGGAD